MKTILIGLMLASPILFGSLGAANAHCIVGNRFFPATLNVDDPCVADELSLPTIAGFKNGDESSAHEIDISGEIRRRLLRISASRSRRNGSILTCLTMARHRALTISAQVSSIRLPKRHPPSSRSR